MTGNWSTILVISLGAAVATALALNLKSRLHGEGGNNPPFLRHVAAYFFAYVLGFFAVETFDRPWALLAVAAVATLAFAVTLNGRKPLMTRAYARTAALTFAVFFALWGLHQALLLIGIDLLAKDFVARS
jgi:hypothetical protein